MKRSKKSKKAAMAMATFNLPADGYREAVDRVSKFASERGCKNYAVVLDMVRQHARAEGAE